MRLLVDISHPAHVHVFRNAIGLWRQQGHQVLITSRVKEMTIDLLATYQLDAEPLSTAPKSKSLLAFAQEMTVHCGRLLGTARRFRADALLQVAGTFIAPVGRILGIPAVAFYDTEFAGLSNTITYPLLSAVCVPDCYEGSAGRREVRYPGYHELAYLHPKRFTPDPKVVLRNGFDPDKPIFVLRFVGFAAAHDYGEAGFSPDGKVRLATKLARLGQLVISSESELPGGLEPYRSPVPYHEIHHVMASARVVAGESATMASEAAVMGVPSVFVSRTGRGYTTEQEQRYGLVHNFTPDREGEAIDATLDLAVDPRARQIWQSKRARMLEDKIDVTDWMVRFVETIPSGIKFG